MFFFFTPTEIIVNDARDVNHMGWIGDEGICCYYSGLIDNGSLFIVRYQIASKENAFPPTHAAKFALTFPSQRSHTLSLSPSQVLPGAI